MGFILKYYQTHFRLSRDFERNKNFKFAKIAENFANYLLKTKTKTSRVLMFLNLHV